MRRLFAIINLKVNYFGFKCWGERDVSGREQELAELEELQNKADDFRAKREITWYILFSKNGFTKGIREEAKQREDVILVDLEQLTAE